MNAFIFRINLHFTSQVSYVYNILLVPGDKVGSIRGQMLLNLLYIIDGLPLTQIGGEGNRQATEETTSTAARESD